MKTITAKICHQVILLISLTLVPSQVMFSGTTDSLSSFWSSGGALQFQLLGGFGVNYFGEILPNSHLRVGADLSYNHSNQSGGGGGYSIYYYTPPSTSGSYIRDTQQEQVSTSYQISLSGLFLQELAESQHVFVYCGGGPIVSYSWYRSTSNSPYTQNDGSTVTTFTTESEYTEKTKGIGPVVIVGVGSRLMGHVALSAEIGGSAIYQWTSSSDSYSSVVANPTSNTSTSKSGSSSYLDGWNVSLKAIRIGVIVEL